MAQDDSGRPYYYNRETQETTWTKPQADSSSTKSTRRLSANVRRASSASLQRRGSTGPPPESAEVGALRAEIEALEEKVAAKDLQLELETSRVADLEGQLHSMYAAYQGVEEDFNATRSEYDLLKSMQEENDARMAAEVASKMEAEEKQRMMRMKQQESGDANLVRRFLQNNGSSSSAGSSVPTAHSLAVHRHGRLLCKVASGAFSKAKMYMVVLHNTKIGVFSEAHPDKPIRQWVILPGTKTVDLKPKGKTKFPFIIENLLLAEKRTGDAVSSVTFIAKSKIEKLKWMEIVLRAAQQIARTS